MWIGLTVVSGRAIAVRELDRQPAADEGFEALVHGRQRDSDEVLTHREIHLVRGGMYVRFGQIPVHGSSLLREAVTSALEGFS